ncbi:MAG: membrane protein of unknown function [Promethearchaeota archaeon]|nr:MAG: membrane protein of unknown function [Candidatus Lokiarchaeota archaeon]
MNVDKNSLFLICSSFGIFIIALWGYILTFDLSINIALSSSHRIFIISQNCIAVIFGFYYLIELLFFRKSLKNPKKNSNRFPKRSSSIISFYFLNAFFLFSIILTLDTLLLKIVLFILFLLEILQIIINVRLINELVFKHMLPNRITGYLCLASILLVINGFVSVIIFYLLYGRENTILLLMTAGMNLFFGISSLSIGAVLSFKKKTLIFEEFGKIIFSPKSWNIGVGALLLGMLIFFPLILYFGAFHSPNFSFMYGIIPIEIIVMESYSMMPLELFLSCLIIVNFGYILQIIAGIVYKK